MSLTRTRRRKLKGTQYAHRILLARTAQQQHGEQLALLGTLLVAVALLFATAGWYESFHATRGLDLSHVDDTPEVRASLEQAVAALTQAKTLRNIGDLALVVGGGCVTLALLGQRFRKRWFFFSTLGLSVMLLLVPVLGTVFAAVWLVTLFLMRREFVQTGRVRIALPD